MLLPSDQREAVSTILRCLPSLVRRVYLHRSTNRVYTSHSGALHVWSHRDPLLQAAEGIRQSIASGNEAVIPGLVDTLLSAPRPFDERLIGGGPWQVHC